jgi:hypothetical protein
VCLHGIRDVAEFVLRQDCLEQELDEGAIRGEGKGVGRLSLAGVHLALVAEEFGIKPERAEVRGPILVDLSTEKLHARMSVATRLQLIQICRSC